MPGLDPTISTAALAAAEKIINAALAYDPATRIALAKLEPQLLAIVITQPPLRVYLAPRADGVHLLGQCEHSTTTELHGSLIALASLLKSDRVNLKDSGVHVTGNSHFLAQLQTILKNIDIDWEEILSKIVGDIAGHQGANFIRSQLQWATDRVDTIQRLGTEFLTEEINALPSRAELNFFYQQVDDIQLDVDRIDARIEQLTRQSHQHIPS